LLLGHNVTSSPHHFVKNVIARELFLRPWQSVVSYFGIG